MGIRLKVEPIDSRIKTFDSFADKSNRKNCINPFEEIKDIVGLRVVCRFLSDIEHIRKAIKSSFNVISEENKIDDNDVKSFGYLSFHFIVEIKNEFKGTRYDNIKNIHFEIQVRTIAMHAWATISHYLEYKTDATIPDNLKRDFYALSGLFYVADKHFEMFFDSKRKSVNKIKKVFEKENPNLNQKINLDNLKAYLNNKFPDRIVTDTKYFTRLIYEINELNYKTLGDIDNMLETTKDAFSAYESENSPDDAVRYSVIGIVRISLWLINDEYSKKFQGAGRNAKKFRHLLRKNSVD